MTHSSYGFINVSRGRQRSRMSEQLCSARSSGEPDTFHFIAPLGRVLKFVVEAGLSDPHFHLQGQEAMFFQVMMQVLQIPFLLND